ncbi:hypothetical protein T02_3349, partial [Trichinella nativa]
MEALSEVFVEISYFCAIFFVLGKSIFFHFPPIWNKLIEIVSVRHKCYYNQQLLLAGCIIKRAGFATISDVSTRIASLCNFFAISRQIRVCTTCDQ